MSKTKRNGGYVLVDFSGVDISTEKLDTNQHPDNSVAIPIYNAIKNNKPVYVENLGSPYPGIKVTPFNMPVFGGGGPDDPDGISIVGLFSNFSVHIEYVDGEEDVVIKAGL